MASFAVFDRVAPLHFPRLPSAEVTRETDLWSRRQLMRNRLLTEAIRVYGYDERIAALALPNPQLATLQAPAIITTFHVGVLPMLGFALQQLPAPVLIVRRHPGGTPHPSFERGATRGTEQERALLFHRCVHFLRTGRFVMIAADPFPTERGALATPFRGGILRLSRGPYALARITGAPLIPLVARWRGARVEFVLGEPVQAAKEETTMAREMASWLDRYLTGAPEELSEQVLNLMK
jgi:lauroyl/myristoyl acyltransferase